MWRPWVSGWMNLTSGMSSHPVRKAGGKKSCFLGNESWKPRWIMLFYHLRFKGYSCCHCPETGTITSVPCISTVNSTQGQPASPISYVHISPVQSHIFLELIFLQAKSFTIFSLALAICKCQRVTRKTGRWKGTRTETSNQGSAACTALDQRCFPLRCLSA